MFHKLTVINILWYQHKNVHVDHSRIYNKETNPDTFGHLILDRDKEHTLEKDNLFKNGAVKTGDTKAEDKIQTHISHTLYKNQDKMDKRSRY